MSEDGPVTTALLRGYLVDGAADEVVIRSGDGTWRFRAADVLIVHDWEDPPATEPGQEPIGRPVQVDVRVGAVGDFSQSFRITIADRPMTLPDQLPEIAPDETFDQQAQAWAARFLFLGEHWPDGGTTRTSCASVSDLEGSDDWFLCDSLD
jgi:hypothetical protein